MSWSPAARRLLPRGARRPRRHPGRHRRRVQTRHRHQLQWNLGLSCPDRLAGQHGRAALSDQSQRQSSLARAGPRLCRQDDQTCCRRAGFLLIYLRGDTDFSQTPTSRTAGIHASDVRFLFGIDAHPALKAIAQELPARPTVILVRPPGLCGSRQHRASDRSGSRRRSSASGNTRRLPTKLEERVAEFEAIARLPADRTIVWSCSASEWGSTREQ